ncbi:hypothetical protein TGVAND_269170 [Toxoplasma gondii VAND]|uniref:Transmembrane protein n=4 Tax=Toxoplasma gondii TaxID=5811 RepID=B9Q5H4_TOXGV|nr:hypothetical protein TGVEG_269170 [Toxoplasma gondii VEG]KFG52439.1 hypothetical protein TGP89_269170 [Toxoplasma gondii p89]KFH06130.1 hypothetical protein TGVAND_269170 [Toxoplasma gondii VAND]PUA87732.1 hypothetical protein TGBR9_269170 [Toxoplasma gondii TgCATBr9]CEL75424.1 TPA: hypothetical protein BN1205_016270 [Toxoplasma gondii VEG]
MRNLRPTVCVLLCLSIVFSPRSEASRLKGKHTYPIAEDQAEASEASDEGLVADKDRAAAQPYSVESMDGVQNTYSHGLDDHHIEPVSGDDDMLLAPESLPEGMGAEVEKIEQVKADEEAETPAPNERTAEYNATDEEKAAAVETVALPGPDEAAPEAAAPDAASPSAGNGVNIVNNCCGSFRQLSHSNGKIGLHLQAKGRFAQEDGDDAEDEAEGSEDEEEEREADIDDAEEEYLERKQEVAENNPREMKKPLSPEEGRKMLMTYVESLESVVNSIVSTHSGVRDMLGTESRKEK